MFLLKCFVILVVVATVVWSTSGDGFCSDVVDCATQGAKIVDYAAIEKMITRKLEELECNCNNVATATTTSTTVTASTTSTPVTDSADGGGWIVIQRRLDGSVDFHRQWKEYVDGFGRKDGEFWLGLEQLHQFTSSGKYELRVDLEDWQGAKRYAKYSTFKIGDAASNYKLTIGGYSGTAGDSMSRENGMAFSTKDRDHDTYGGNCAVTFKGAWWYSACHEANLNGFYHKGGPHSSFADGVNWQKWRDYKYSMKFVEMKIRLKPKTELECNSGATTATDSTDGCGWVVMQRRLDGSVDFQRGWQEYVDGFGREDGEYWLGLETLHQLTSSRKYQLRVDLEDWEGNKRYAKYSTFKIGDAASNYKITIGGYSGTAGDSMSRENGMAFSTKDRDHDTWGGSCAVIYKGAWWYSACHEANLNGFYHKGGPHSSFADGVNWQKWKDYKYSMKFVEMKIRPAL